MKVVMALSVFLTLCCELEGSALVTNCAQLAQHITEGSGEGQRFLLDNVDVFLIDPAKSAMSVQDGRFASPSLIISNKCPAHKDFGSGDRVNIAGFIRRNKAGDMCAIVDSVAILDHGAPIRPKMISGPDFYRPENDYRQVTLHGIVNEIVRDEIDPEYVYFSLLCQGETVYMGYSTAQSSQNDLQSLIGAEIQVVGMALPRLFGHRQFLGRTLQGVYERVLKAPPADPFACPDIERIRFQTPSEIARAGRHGTRGCVLAVWNLGQTFLLRSDSGLIVQVDQTHTNAPAVGTTVRAAGIPLSNAHCLNLVHANWTSAPDLNAAGQEQEASLVHARDILEDESNRVKIKPQYHGKLIRIEGVVHGIFNAGNKDRQLLVEDDGYLIPVNLYACPDITERVSVGCRMSVTGICVMDIDSISPIIAFPRIRGFSVLARNGADIVIISRPPWLTVGKLLAFAGGLFVLLIVVLIWNFSLRRIAARRSRELFRSQVGKIRSELQVKERTRIAVELHDSLAQNLTGVSMEIEAAERSRKDGMDAVFQHIFIADKALKSCRNELRNSLWDLRSWALEEPDLDKAIRQTLLPHVKGVSLHVRFNVPRSRFSDSTLHDILRIIRELTINGIRHGGATEIRIAGAIDNDRLTFSVADNGCGFDADTHPGVADGHFGIQGITERLDAYSGNLSFTSNGKVTKAVVTIPLPGQEEPEQ